MKRILAIAALMVVPTLAQAQMQPGEWEVTTKVTSFDMPNAPPQVAEAFKQPRVQKHCVTPEQATSGPLGMLKDRQPGCKVNRENTSGGKFDAVIACDLPNGGTMTATVTGSFSATRFDANVAIDQTGPQAVKMTTVSAAERIGECK